MMTMPPQYRRSVTFYVCPLLLVHAHPLLGWVLPRVSIQPLYVSIMERAGTAGVPHDNEGSGFGFRTVRYVEPALTELPTTCKMQRPI